MHRTTNDTHTFTRTPMRHALRLPVVSISLLVAALCGAPTQAQEAATPPAASFVSARSDMERRLDEALKELSSLRERIAAEKIPLSRELATLEGEVVTIRQELQRVTRQLDDRKLDLSKLRTGIRSRDEESGYLASLLGEYTRNFEAGLHIAELQRFRTKLGEVKLAAENPNLSDDEIFRAQSVLLGDSIARLEDALGGVRFDGSAVTAEGLVRPGTFVVVGPAAIFRAADGSAVGTAEQRLGSLEPSVVAFEAPEVAETAASLTMATGARFPLDPTLGNAHKIAATEETIQEHLAKGGPVVYPILALAAAAMLVALYKWITMLAVRSPSRRQMRELLAAVRTRDRAAVTRLAAAMPGPSGKMLRAAAEHFGEPRELVEEVMYEVVLATRLRLQGLLPFVAVAAAAAPLLGLLGTVTGIMNTFKLITVFGTGDVKTLSSGISEALITTELGLVAAIPALLIHAYLWRKAKGVVDGMEKSAIAYINELVKSPAPSHNSTPAATAVPSAPSAPAVAEQVA